MNNKSPKIQARSTLSAIRKKCLECSDGPKAVRECPSGNCPLHPFRMGKNPFRKKRTLSDGEKRKLLSRLSGSVAE